jgi:hypothetical protein
MDLSVHAGFFSAEKKGANPTVDGEKGWCSHPFREQELKKKKNKIYKSWKERQKKHKKQLMGQRIMHHRSMDFEPSKVFWNLMRVLQVQMNVSRTFIVLETTSWYHT